MRAIGYYLALPLIYLVSVLPFPLLYGFSDFMFFLIFRVAGYRKKVVYGNLKNSFPEKSDEEIHKLAKAFYHYLIDLGLESFKTISISPEKMLKHCYLKPEAEKLFETLYAEKKNLILVMGHYGNWEWAGNTFSLKSKYQLYVIYHELKNKYFNKLIVGMRTKFGTKLIPMQHTMREMLDLKNRPLSATAFITDQAPNPDRAHWLKFMNQDTPVFTGTEKFAKKLDSPVVYVSVQRKKRGYYEIDAELLFRNPSETVAGEITERHTHRLEEDILNLPSTWLWSHRRWKHKRKTDS
ncbi:lysophospholipid acyltransferase family protein [soil metagenome]